MEERTSKEIDQQLDPNSLGKGVSFVGMHSPIRGETERANLVCHPMPRPTPLFPSSPLLPATVEEHGHPKIGAHASHNHDDFSALGCSGRVLFNSQPHQHLPPNASGLDTPPHHGPPSKCSPCQPVAGWFVHSFHRTFAFTMIISNSFLSGSVEGFTLMSSDVLYCLSDLILFHLEGRLFPFHALGTKNH